MTIRSEDVRGLRNSKSFNRLAARRIEIKAAMDLLNEELETLKAPILKVLKKHLPEDEKTIYFQGHPFTLVSSAGRSSWDSKKLAKILTPAQIRSAKKKGKPYETVSVGAFDPKIDDE